MNKVILATLAFLLLISVFALIPIKAQAVCWCTPDGLGCIGGSRPSFFGRPGGSASGIASFYLFPSDAWPRCIKQTLAAVTPTPSQATTTRIVAARQAVVEKPAPKKPAGIPWCTADCAVQTELE